MILAAAYTLAVLALLAAIARGTRILRAARAAILRARWAWRCHGTTVPGDGETLTREEIQALGNLAAGRDVRSRT